MFETRGIDIVDNVNSYSLKEVWENFQVPDSGRWAIILIKTEGEVPSLHYNSSYERAL